MKNNIAIFLIAIIVIPVPFLFKKTIMDTQELQRQLNELQQRVDSIDAQRLSYPLDANSRSVLERVTDDFLLDKVFDLTWKKMFHYLTTFESINTTNSGFGVVAVGGSVTADGTQVTISTGGTSSNSAEVYKRPFNFGPSSFNQKSNFRTAIDLSASTNQTVYIIVGKTGANDYYGFKVVNGNLYGVTKDGTTENAVLLQTVTSSTIYNIEARYVPGVKVSFYVDAIYKGTSTVNLPRPYVSGSVVVNKNLFDILVTTNENAIKTLTVSFFEFLQFRNVLK